jgi:hypothetical protein
VAHLPFIWFANIRIDANRSKQVSSALAPLAVVAHPSKTKQYTFFASSSIPISGEDDKWSTDYSPNIHCIVA